MPYYPKGSFLFAPIDAHMVRPVILITGSTDGIGKATALELASQGAEVILHGRNIGKGQTVQRELEETCGCQMPDLLIADFSEQDQILQMVRDITARYTRLDVLINNAGTYEKDLRLTKDGVEMTFAVNYLAPFILSDRLLPLMQRSAPSRIITVASAAHENVHRIDWNNLQGERAYDAWNAYALSKFADIAFTYTLARRIRRTGITANCLHPGVVSTKLLRSAFPNITGIPPEEGARTSVYLAISPDVAGVSGQYFDSRRPVRSSALTVDRLVQDRLWKIAEDLTGIGVTDSMRDISESY